MLEIIKLLVVSTLSYIISLAIAVAVTFYGFNHGIAAYLHCPEMTVQQTFFIVIGLRVLAEFLGRKK